MNYMLHELEEPLRRALERLISKAEVDLAFVVAQKVTDESVFVQWCTKDGRLLFDVPWAKIVGEPMSVDASIDRAVDLLRGVGVCDDDRVLIIEDDQRDRGDGIIDRILKFKFT